MITFAVLMALVVLALEWTHRHRPYPRDPRAGSIDGPDRDRDRVLVDLRAAADRK